ASPKGYDGGPGIGAAAGGNRVVDRVLSPALSAETVRLAGPGYRDPPAVRAAAGAPRVGDQGAGPCSGCQVALHWQPLRTGAGAGADAAGSGSVGADRAAGRLPAGR